jgi:hypothetical protein
MQPQYTTHPNICAYATRFWSHVDKSGDCWTWTASRCNGYGQLGIQHKHLAAHRVAYELTYGPIPDGLFVCHRCDNKLCVRPEHLFLGTDGDNTRDAATKGLMLTGEKWRETHSSVYGERCWLHKHPETMRGENNGHAILTTADVLQIRQMLIDGISQNEIGRRFGVSSGAIWQIANGRSWKHVQLTPVHD